MKAAAPPAAAVTEIREVEALITGFPSQLSDGLKEYLQEQCGNQVQTFFLNRIESVLLLFASEAVAASFLKDRG
jgi:hypothetical protein